MDWIDKNPAILMKRVEAEVKPTVYFTKEEFNAIVDATYAYGNWLGGHDFENRRDRLRALVLLMRWSGLAIKDAGEAGAQSHQCGWKRFSVPGQDRRIGLCSFVSSCAPNSCVLFPARTHAISSGVAMAILQPANEDGLAPWRGSSS
jgi:hypothetical protein